MGPADTGPFSTLVGGIMNSAVKSKEHPIIFSEEMVRAILEGRKTMTRRVITEAYKSRRKDGCKLVPDLLQRMGDVGRACPYGVSGDRLWVREGWRPLEGKWRCRKCGAREGQSFCAGGCKAYWPDVGYRADADLPGAWKSSMFMPRVHSRLTLEITDVRVERVQDISEEDARVEGVEQRIAGVSEHGPVKTFRTGFVYLWNSINAKRGYGWNENPWVWVISFKKMER